MTVSFPSLILAEHSCCEDNKSWVEESTTGLTSSGCKQLTIHTSSFGRAEHLQKILTCREVKGLGNSGV